MSEPLDGAAMRAWLEAGPLTQTFVPKEFERVVSLIVFQDELYVAITSGVYVFRGGKFVPLMVVSEARGPIPMVDVDGNQIAVLGEPIIADAPNGDEVAAHIEQHGEPPQEPEPTWREKRGLR